MVNLLFSQRKTQKYVLEKGVTIHNVSIWNNNNQLGYLEEKGYSYNHRLENVKKTCWQFSSTKFVKIIDSKRMITSRKGNQNLHNVPTLNNNNRLGYHLHYETFDEQGYSDDIEYKIVQNMLAIFLDKIC